MVRGGWLSAFLLASVTLAVPLVAVAASPSRRVTAVGRQVVTTSPAEVKVGEAAPMPARLVIRVGGSVTWANTGKRAHRVASDTKAWPAFSLAPGNRRTIRFAKPGRYPYHVDGARKGLIIVTAVSSGPSGGNGSSGGKGSSASGLVVERYAISVKLEAAAKGTDENGTAGVTVWSDKEQWSYSWLDVSLYVFPAASGRPVAIGGHATRGVVQASESFIFNDPPDIYHPTNCTGSVSTQTYKDGDVALNDGGQGLASFVTDSESGTPRFADTVAQKVQSRCSGGSIAAVHIASRPEPFPFTLPDKLKFDLNSPSFSVNWTTPTSTKELPLSDLAAGRSLDIESGKQTQSFNTTGANETVTEAVSVRFRFLGRGTSGSK